MDALLTAIVLWLSLNFNLPATDQHPRIDIVPAMEIVFRRYGALTPEARLDVSSRYVSAHSSSEGREVLAVYDQATKTILLLKDGPAERLRSCRCWFTSWYTISRIRRI